MSSSTGYTIETRHQAGRNACPKRADKTRRCRCSPSHRARVWDAKHKRAEPGPWTKDLEQAREWAIDLIVRNRKGMDLAAGRMTVSEAGDWLFDGIDAGRFFSRTKSAGERVPFKPSTVRGYKQCWRDHLEPHLGNVMIHDLRAPRVQDLIWDLWASGKSEKDGENEAVGLGASTVRNVIMPLRVLYRELRRAELVDYNPTHDLDLPPGIGKRERVIELDLIAPTLEALDVEDRALWATALYAGPRHGELKAMRADWVSFDEGYIQVDDSWDQYEGPVGPKSRAGTRRIPIVEALEPHLRRALERHPEGLLFGRAPDVPFQSNTVQNRADAAWKRAGLPRWTLHEYRHSFVSHAYMAGVLPKTIQEWAGHSSLQFTLDYYTHLTVKHHAREAVQFSAYLLGKRVGSDGADGPRTM